MGKERKYLAYFTSKAARNKDWYCEQGIKQQRLIWHRGMDTEFGWQKIKADKKMTRLFSIEFNVLDFSTPFIFFPQLFTRLNVVRVLEGKWYRNDLKGNKNYFELAGGSSYLESTVFYSKWRLYVRRRHIPGINIALLITYCQVTDLNFPQVIACLFGAGRP